MIKVTSTASGYAIGLMSTAIGYEGSYEAYLDGFTLELLLHTVGEYYLDQTIICDIPEVQAGLLDLGFMFLYSPTVFTYLTKDEVLYRSAV